MGEDSLRNPDLVREMEARGSVVSKARLMANSSEGPAGATVGPYLVFLELFVSPKHHGALKAPERGALLFPFGSSAGA